MYQTDQILHMCRLGFELFFLELHRVIIYSLHCTWWKVVYEDIWPRNVTGTSSVAQVYTTNEPFLKADLQIGHVFAKCLILNVSVGLPIGCQKHLCIQIW